MNIVSDILEVFLTIIILALFFEYCIRTERAVDTDIDVDTGIDVEELQLEPHLDNPPPQYTPPSTCSSKNPNRTIHVGPLDICIDCIPQMTWTNHQCKIWLVKLLALRCGHCEQDAAQMARNFTGFGATLYSINGLGFSQIFKFERGDAMGIWKLLCSFAPETIGLSELQLREVYKRREAAVRIQQEGAGNGEI